MKRLMNKKGQQTAGLPFGMIFAIFLIVVFIVIAFMAIGYFLDWGKTATVGTFYEHLQDSVNTAWEGQASSFSFPIDLPSEITTICFANLSRDTNAFPNEYEQIKDFSHQDANVFLIPPQEAQELEYKLIKRIDLERITNNKNPYCVDAEEKLKISKDFYDKLVMIE